MKDNRYAIDRTGMTRQGPGKALTLIGTLLIVLATLGPGSRTEPAERLPTLCLLCGDFGTVDFILNIALFVPFGLGIALLGASPLAAFVISLCLTLGIESAQATLIVGRHAALGDVVANTLGGLLGATAPRWWNRLAFPTQKLALRLAVATALVAAAIATLGPFLFRPSAPQTQVWWGQHAHELGGLSRFEGQVESVTLNGIPIPDGILPDQRSPRLAFANPRLEFVATIITGPRPPDRAQIAAIADGTGGWPAAFWQDGPDAIASLRLHSEDLLLRAPIVRIPGALAVPPGSRVTLRVTATPGSLTGTAETPAGPSRTTSIRLSTTQAWQLLWPWGATFARDPSTRTTLWLVDLFGLSTLLLLWWGRLAGRPRLSAILLLALVPWTLLAVPLVTSTPVARWWEWAAALAGLVAGGALAFTIGPRPSASP